MKVWLCLFSFVFSLNAFAGGYYTPSIDLYDQATGLYYKAIMKSGKKSLLSGESSYIGNINIFNPLTKKSQVLFSGEGENRITHFLFEKSVQDGKVDFFNASTSMIKNNYVDDSRKIKDKLLVGVYNIEDKVTTYYTASKNGGNLNMYFKVKAYQSWHLDVKNSVIRIVTPTDNGLHINDIKW